MNKLVIGILAHVDAGKTTLSESMLYLAGRTHRLGRVDNKDAYLDTHDLERERGITIFSQQALLALGDLQITLLDTPGHVDFAAEMERTLQVLDYAILVISGVDGVQGHTSTLWALLDAYQVPVFVFVNKMDQPGADRELVLHALQSQLSGGCIAFGQKDEHFCEQLALCDEGLMESYLDHGQIEPGEIRRAIQRRRVFPCFFGSALKLDGVEQFMAGLADLVNIPWYPQEFGAKVFKISRDDLGHRLTHIKLTGGCLRVRDLVTHGEWEEKVNQIRIYSGEKFDLVDSVQAGTICAVTGLGQAKPGDGLGIESSSHPPFLEPVLSYRVVPEEGYEARVLLPQLRQLEEEEPRLAIVWDEELQEIQAQVMGDVQIEILQSMIQSRFGVSVSFDAGRILYKETIANMVEGVGHFEPLRHYAEVHLILEPQDAGSGLQYVLDCSEDVLAKNWQRLILSHLKEKPHRGVLTGSPVTDMKISVVSGRAHNTHTVGGDFREATFRAVRQGLKEAQSILLEPYYRFRLEVPEKMIGRAITDVEKMHGSWTIVETKGEAAILAGTAPVATMRNYQREVAGYTRGLGRLFLSPEGYKPCHNSEDVIKSMGYDSERDVENPTGSIFCSQGTGFYVPWDQVKDHMHVESHLRHRVDQKGPAQTGEPAPWEELDEDDYRYLNTTANQGKRVGWNRRKLPSDPSPTPERQPAPIGEPRDCFLLVDGYNVIHAWPELKELAVGHMDAARMRLLDILSSYRGIQQCEIIVVFDAYMVAGRPEEISDYHNIHVVFTREAQTADEYIEKFAYGHQKKHDIAVVTSDALQQVVIRGAGSRLISARELREEVETALENAKRSLGLKQPFSRTPLEEALTPKVKKQMEDLT